MMFEHVWCLNVGFLTQQFCVYQYVNHAFYLILTTSSELAQHPQVLGCGRDDSHLSNCSSLETTYQSTKEMSLCHTPVLPSFLPCGDDVTVGNYTVQYLNLYQSQRCKSNLHHTQKLSYLQAPKNLILYLHHKPLQNSSPGFHNNRLVPNRKRSTSRLYIVTLLI